MKKILLFLQFIFVFTLASCYEDKGNYEYKDIQKITIDDFKYQIVSLGEQIKITPKTNIDVTKEDYYSFKWTVDGEERPEWNKFEFVWIANKVVKEKLIVFEITDTRYGTKYFKTTGCEVKPIFDAQDSWVVLADDNGNSQLSLFDYWDYNIEGDVVIPTDVKLYRDLTHTQLNYDLGRGPIGLQEFFCEDRETKGAFIVLQESGAVDIDGTSMNKMNDIAKYFDGGVFPNNSYAISCSYMMWYNVLADKNGILYGRIKSSKEFFNSEYFLPEPIRYKGEVLEQCELLRGFYSKQGKHSLIIDRKKSRLLAMLDGETHWQGNMKYAGEIMEIPEKLSEAPAGWVSINNFAGYELKSAKYFKYRLYGQIFTCYAILLKNKTTGQYTLQTFKAKRASGYEPAMAPIEAMNIFKIEGIGEPSLMCVPTSDASDYAFFAVGSKLYLLDRSNASDPIKLFMSSFNSKITAMECEDNYNSQMGVGLEDGTFYILDIRDAKNKVSMPDDKKILYVTPVNSKLGKIVDIKRKKQVDWYF